jgi:hypothetical protein
MCFPQRMVNSQRENISTEERMAKGTHRIAFGTHTRTFRPSDGCVAEDDAPCLYLLIKKA